MARDVEAAVLVGKITTNSLGAEAEAKAPEAEEPESVHRPPRFHIIGFGNVAATTNDDDYEK